MQSAGKTAKACNLMENIFELNLEEILIPNFNQIKNQADYDLLVSSDIENYTLLFNQYIQIVAHYGLLLQKTSKLDKSIEVLKQLTNLSPNDPQIYLYLADSFWLSDNKSQATIFYSKYIDMIKSSGIGNKAANRALLRTNVSNAKN